ncbi:MAG: PEGA domain-containing protein [Myxococcales bacterium]|nr:PEGA domain-containing protein [Myxococcales bacterium]
MQRSIALIVMAVPFWSSASRADEAPTAPTAAEDPKTTRARQDFQRGVELVKAAQWGEALSAFEASELARPHPVTTFNVGACQRAMSHYALARKTLLRALAEQRPGAELPPNLAADAKGFVDQIESTLLSYVAVTIHPAQVTIVVDGRPLAVDDRPSKRPTLIAGVLPPGKGRLAPAAEIELVLDPGVHVITLTRKGFADVVVNKTFSSGRQPALSLELSKLPATLRVSANVPDALVNVNGQDIGPVPVDVLRPAGTHKVVVRKAGYGESETVITVSAGEQSDLRARLTLEQVPLTKRWWFWVSAGAVVAGGVALTYALTRPDPSAPPYDGGSTGWVAKPQGLRF